MAYDLEEQEQLAAFKAFWNQYGNLLTWVLIIALGSYVGYTYWKYYEREQSSQASGLYVEMLKYADAKDGAKTQRMASEIQTKYARSAYAQMSAMTAARVAFDANDLKGAKANLQWVVEHGSPEYQSVAKLRLVSVLIDEKAYDEGMKLLATPFLSQFAGDVADRKGDILVAQNKLADARSAYLAALAAIDKNAPARQLIVLKLEAIGGSAPVVKAAA